MARGLCRFSSCLFAFALLTSQHTNAYSRTLTRVRASRGGFSPIQLRLPKTGEAYRASPSRFGSLESFTDAEHANPSETLGEKTDRIRIEGARSLETPTDRLAALSPEEKTAPLRMRTLEHQAPVEGRGERLLHSVMPLGAAAIGLFPLILFDAPLPYYFLLAASLGAIVWTKRRKD